MQLVPRLEHLFLSQETREVVHSEVGKHCARGSPDDKEGKMSKGDPTRLANMTVSTRRYFISKLNSLLLSPCLSG